MRISSMDFRNFSNVTESPIVFDPRVTVFCDHNGKDKNKILTTIIDAAYISIVAKYTNQMQEIDIDWAYWNKRCSVGFAMRFDRDDQLFSILFAPHGRKKITREQLADVNKKSEFFVMSYDMNNYSRYIDLFADIARDSISFNDNENLASNDGIIFIANFGDNQHPALHVNMVKRLTDMFPKCQFILTTNSPLVINHLFSQNVYLVTEDEISGYSIEHPDSSYGKSCSRTLIDIMGVENELPEDIKQRLKSIYDSINEHKFDEAKNKIDEFRNIGYDEPELDSAKTALFVKSRLVSIYNEEFKDKE